MQNFDHNFSFFKLFIVYKYIMINWFKEHNIPTVIIPTIKIP